MKSMKRLALFLGLCGLVVLALALSFLLFWPTPGTPVAGTACPIARSRTLRAQWAAQGGQAICQRGWVRP